MSSVCLRLTGLENYLNFKGDASPVTTAFAKQVIFKFWTQLQLLQDTLL
jgi:hypothetical protein